MDDSAEARTLTGMDLPGREEQARRLWLRWRQGERPDVWEFLTAAGTPSPAQAAAVLRVDQRERWLAGERVPAEEYLKRCRAVQAETELAVELIDAEYLLREELGERPYPDGFQRRFPPLAGRLRLPFELPQALGSVPAPGGSPTFPPVGRTTHAAGPEAATAFGFPGAWPEVAGYEILGEFGRGAMGVVYRARQTALNRSVALKMILAGPHADAEQLARFRAEAEAVARFQHPNIVQIHEVSEQDGLPFFSLEFVAGGSLAQRLAGRPQPPREAADLVAVLADAIHYAHQRGVVHRDLKPANVLLAACGLARDAKPQAALVPKITDFGLAKKLDQPAGVTASGVVMGTPSYMAPEQAQGKGKEVGPAADVYALGAILYECLTGRPPFLGETTLDTLMQVIHDEPVPPRRLQPTCPRDLETVCLKCLHKDPRRRYATAGDLAEDLRRLLRHEPIRARPVGRWERGGKWAQRHPAIAGLSGLVLVVALLGFGGVTWKWQDEAFQRQRAEEAERSEHARAEAEKQAKEDERKAKDSEHLARVAEADAL